MATGLLTAPEVALKLRCDVRTVYRRVRRGELAALRFGRLVLFEWPACLEPARRPAANVAEIDAWLDRTLDERRARGKRQRRNGRARVGTTSP